MISDKTLKRVENYTDNEINEALDNWDKKRWCVKPVREELGGDYYYKCGWFPCNHYITGMDNYCSQCGTKIKWD